MQSAKPIHEQIKSYLLNTRRLTESSIIEWQLGLCPDWKVVAPEIGAAGKTKLAEACGLLRTSNDSTYDFLHHRITIPIHNVNGQLVGFGGRVLPGGDGPKYTNPPESPIYPKSKILFGLHKARKHFKEHGGALLVEGYFDTIKLHQCEWNNTVASCGTALTDEQCKLLKRFTDTVFVMRDGDKAGRRAAEKDVVALVKHQFKVFVILLPEKEDPDSLFDKINTDYWYSILDSFKDGIEWLIEQDFNEALASGNASLMAEAIDSAVDLLADITNTVRREQYVKNICKQFKSVKVTDLMKPIAKELQRREDEKREAEEATTDKTNRLPGWVDKDFLQEHGFVQLKKSTTTHIAGIYFPGDGNTLVRTTNFTIEPLYHVYEMANNRRLMEINNCTRSAVVEMPANGLTTKSIFENVVSEKGNFHCDYSFGPKQFNKLSAWLKFKMPIAYELKTLGWQGEGFFAFSNAVYTPVDGKLLEYDDMGMIKVGDQIFLSLGNSKIHRDERQDDNPYENDLYLKYVQSKQVTFADWAKVYHQCYTVNAPYGIAFVFLTMFKDIVVRIAKMPLFYCYGPKGSGKSAMAESTQWLFFSGKDSTGKLMSGFNLNPGQSTPFSFFNRVERFRNCPILLNEFDESVIEDWKFGALKGYYDGESREVGDGDTFKKKKTKQQKINGTVIIVGQYLSIRDDGSVLSRSIPLQFQLNRIDDLSDAQRNAFDQLQTWQHEGLSSVILELMQHRPKVQQTLKNAFTECQQTLMDGFREKGLRIEARLVSNYSLYLAAARTMEELGIQLPYTYAQFYDQAFNDVVNFNRMLKDNSAIHQFWKMVENLFDGGFLVTNTHLKVKAVAHVRLKKGESTEVREFHSMKRLLFIRFSNVYGIYSKYSRERSGKAALPEDTLLMYMKEQPYYIGLAPNEYWTDKPTSGYVFDYDMMEQFGIVLHKHDDGPLPPTPTTPTATPPPAPPIDHEPEFLTKKYGFEKP
jgi:DNA primase